MILRIQAPAIEWVYVYPLEDPKKEVFLFIFWSGNTINPEETLIVCWDKQRELFDYILPKTFVKSIELFLKGKNSQKFKLGKMLNAYNRYKRANGIKDDEKSISLKKYPALLELILGALPHTLPEGTNALARRVAPHKREKAYNISKFDIEKALHSGGGMWKEFEPRSIDRNLLNKYRKNHSLSRILGRKKGMSFQELLMWSMSSRKSYVVPMYQINDATLTRMQNKAGLDPLRTVRGFLRFIGEAHTNQGGEKKRSHMTVEVKDSSVGTLLDKYPRGDASDQNIKEVCKDELGREPHKTEINLIKKLYISSSK